MHPHQVFFQKITRIPSKLLPSCVWPNQDKNPPRGFPFQYFKHYPLPWRWLGPPRGAIRIVRRGRAEAAYTSLAIKSQPRHPVGSLRGGNDYSHYTRTPSFHNHLNYNQCAMLQQTNSNIMLQAFTNQVSNTNGTDSFKII